jgi:DNA-binding NtrC family response regulator
LAKSDVPVLLEGETGTGKELLAEALHEASARANGPFVVFDCSAISPSLVESQLFGHERGAFTGAAQMRKGVFELADGGTLFIDEIGDLDIALQARLLRAIERGEVCRLGSERWIKVNVRILAATRRDLDREVQAGRFRDDLFFRLAVARIELPALRRRHGDIALLSRQFWDALGGKGRPLPYELFERFEEYAWPGNVRELYNAVARSLALGDLAEFDTPPSDDASHEPDVVDRIIDLDLPLPRAKQRMMAEFERRYVERILSRHAGDARRAAEASGIARRYFNLLRARHGA